MLVDEIQRIIYVICIGFLYDRLIVVLILPHGSEFGGRIQNPAVYHETEISKQIKLDFRESLIGTDYLIYFQLLKDTFNQIVRKQFRMPNDMLPL